MLPLENRNRIVGVRVRFLPFKIKYNESGCRVYAPGFARPNSPGWWDLLFRFRAGLCREVKSGWSGTLVWNPCERPAAENPFQGVACWFFPVFCSGSYSWNSLCSFRSIVRIAFDGVLSGIRDCHRSSVVFFVGHRAGTIYGRCSKDVFVRELSTLNFLRCKVTETKIQCSTRRWKIYKMKF